MSENKKVKAPEVSEPPEHPDDRAMRLAGEKYGRTHGPSFAAAHAAKFTKLISTWADADAEAMLSDLREKFWSKMS